MYGEWHLRGFTSSYMISDGIFLDTIMSKKLGAFGLMAGSVEAAMAAASTSPAKSVMNLWV